MGCQRDIKLSFLDKTLNESKGEKHVSHNISSKSAFVIIFVKGSDVQSFCRLSNLNMTPFSLTDVLYAESDTLGELVTFIDFLKI
jgi:hypothetical protein